MNKFGIFQCVDVKENGYSGFCVILACITDPTFMLFFPISKENSKTLNYVLDADNKVDANTATLGIYKTMIDSWTAGDRYLSGIIFDATNSKDAKDEVITIKLAISDSNGHLDGIVPCNFLHAILLAAMEGVEIIVTDKLLSKMLPDEENDTPPVKDTHHFPEDKKIMSIAKKIMSGKIKDD